MEKTEMTKQGSCRTGLQGCGRGHCHCWYQVTAPQPTAFPMQEKFKKKKKKKNHLTKKCQACPSVGPRLIVNANEALLQH